MPALNVHSSRAAVVRTPVPTSTAPRANTDRLKPSKMLRNLRALFPLGPSLCSHTDHKQQPLRLTKFRVGSIAVLMNITQT